MTNAAKFFEERLLNRETKRWEGINLTYEENTYERDKPLDYLTYLCLELRELKSNPIVVELGAARQGMNHDRFQLNPHCCNDGHSTFFWIDEGFEVHSVDINPESPSFLGERSQKSNYKFHCVDGVEFLRDFSGEIDLLFLDAWDVGPGIPFAEKHLDAFMAAENKLAKKHLIAIDDTDVGAGGKGKLLIPELERRNYRTITNGRITIFSNY